MTEKRTPDPTLMARLQLSVKGVDWAAARVKQWQHTQIDGEWSAHQHLVHLLAVEKGNFQARLRRILEEDRPALVHWDNDRAMGENYPHAADIEELAERFMAARSETYEAFKALTPEQWARTGIWPDGHEIDLAWLAEKCLWHALDHFVFLLDLHGEVEHRQA